jgi:hypothetical protein
MTLLDILLQMREKLLSLKAHHNAKEAQELFAALVLLREISYMNPNRDITNMIIALLEVARDMVMGVSWKSSIPTVEQLEAVFSEAS